MKIKLERTTPPAPAAPAPDADASAGLVEALRICWNKHCATHMNSQRARAADLIEQQARELARVTRLANINRMCVELAKDEPEPPTESVGSPVPPEWPDRIKLANALIAARAAIAAADADAARYRFLRMSPTQLGWDADYRPDEVDAAIDAARAAMGEG